MLAQSSTCSRSVATSLRSSDSTLLPAPDVLGHSDPCSPIPQARIGLWLASLHQRWSCPVPVLCLQLPMR